MPKVAADEEPAGREPYEADLWAAFCRHDHDCDGHLGFEELVDALTDLEIAGLALRAARLRREVAPQLELDGVDFDEFCGVADALIAAPPAPAHDEPAPPTLMLARAFTAGVPPPPPAAEAAATAPPLDEDVQRADARPSGDAETVKQQWRQWQQPLWKRQWRKYQQQRFGDQRQL